MLLSEILEAETVKEEVKKHAVETLVATKSPPVNESAPSQRFDGRL